MEHKTATYIEQEDTQSRERNVADKLVQCMEELEGVQYVFTVPGKETAPLLFAIDNSQKRTLKSVVCRHEQAAVFMADGYARMTGHPQIVLATLGPGATNCVTGIANALLDEVPLMLITAQASTTRMHRSSFQLIDTRAMFAPLTVGLNEPIRNAQAVPEVVSKAFQLAKTKFGPTHMILSEDIAKQPIDEEQWDQLPPMQVCSDRCMPYPNETALQEAALFLMQSKKPVILAGRNIVRQQESVYGLLRLVDQCNIMFMTTTLAKGILDSDHPNSLFTAGYNCTWNRLKSVLGQSDCIISIGYDQRELQPELWNKNLTRKIIHIDYMPTEPNVHFNPEYTVTGDIAIALEHLADHLQKADKRFDKADEFVQARSELHGLLDPTRIQESASRGASPQKVLHDVRHLMDDSDILVSDMGNHTLFVSKYWKSRLQKTCIVPSNFATMGFGLPAAIGVKMARSDKKVVAIVGDGGLMMNIQEMETAKRLGANILVIVFNDQAYGMIKWEMETEYGDGKCTCVNFENPDFVRLAESFGWAGYRCVMEKEFPIVLARAMDALQNGPVLIDVAVDYTSTMKNLNE